MEFDLENPLTNFDLGDSLYPEAASLFLLEPEHMLSDAYVKSLNLGDSDFIVRQETISSISQLCCKFDPFLPYLAINYLDRFLSSQALQKPKPWVLRLLAVSCVSLAAKMQRTEFSLPCFQGDGGLIFDVQTIQRMEMMILGALKWRMRSITPFSFLPFFITMFEPEKDPAASRHALKARASHIIFSAQNDPKLLEFKPSDIAASALLTAARDLFPSQLSGFQRAILGCSFVNKDSISGCYDAIQEVAMAMAMEDGYESGVDDGQLGSSETPVSVLGLQLSSSGRLLKRRRIGGEVTCNQTVQMSQL